MAKILKGVEVTKAITERVSQQVDSLKKLGVIPTLAIVRVGERPDDIAYQRSATKRCEAVGIAVETHMIEESAGQDALLSLFNQLNEDEHIHGVLLLRPLPVGYDDALIRSALLPQKDVDGITDSSLAGVFTNQSLGYPPCTAQACMELLQHYDIACAGKHAVVIGRSLVVGKPLAMLLINQNATVTMCHSKTKDLSTICRNADVLISAAGQQGLLNADCFQDSQTVIDVGIHVDDAGQLSGDIDFNLAEPLTGAITPVPGGVGPITTCVLAAHVTEAALRATTNKQSF